jgi:hypothetical protein
VGTDSAGRQVFGELCLDEARVSVAGSNLAPHGLVGGTSLLVLGFVDVGDALSVVEQGRLGVIAVLNLKDSLVLLLGALASLKVQKCSSLVESSPKRGHYGF